MSNAPLLFFNPREHRFLLNIIHPFSKKGYCAVLARYFHFSPLFLFLLILLYGSLADAEELPKLSLKALSISGETITVDGLLEEPVWNVNPPATGFVQQRPVPGTPAQAESFVWVAYDQNNLYVAAALNDPEPVLIRGDERHRDAAMERSDTFSVLIDPYHDHQGGFFFETNILSAMSDAIISQEGERINRGWDSLWEVASMRSEKGWSVEIRIPFETLRFHPGKEQQWGIQFRRRAIHLKEVSFWAPLTPEQFFFEVSRAGHLTGINPPLQARRLSIKPYVRGAYQRTRSNAWDVDHDAGLDLRYHFQTDLILDLTFNTDFAETEVDRFQANLTRFPLFFPEKREFFLEGRDFYDFGLTGRVQPFFSRRIGLIDQTSIPIAGGGKLTGKIGPYGVGFLLMQTEREGEVPAERFGVLRLSRDLGVRSNLGLIATDRAESGEPGERTVGVDATIAPHPNLSANAFWLGSGESGSLGSGEAAYGRISWRDPFWRIGMSHLRIDERFDPALGFVEQTDLKETEGSIDIRPQPTAGPVREFGFKSELTYQTDTGGYFLYRGDYWRAQADFRSGDFVLASWNPQAERLPFDFEIRPGMTIPEGIYRYEEYQIRFASDARRPISTEIGVRWGGFYGGTKKSLNLGVTAAPAEGLKLGAGWKTDAVRLPQGDFVAQIVEGEVKWSPTNRLLFHGLAQWSREERAVAANLRLSWEYRSGSHLFLIANPFRQTGGGGTLYLVKVTWLWESMLRKGLNGAEEETGKQRNRSSAP
ncbi:MAG: hypothetical protein EPO39_06480 [Candidatus Manganitrophaceae bacterium]|nr:MAG: hypothetical protein EPO39_06480 [Candidatus Manganitrophaceae bacterium]